MLVRCVGDNSAFKELAHLVEKVHRFQFIIWSKADTPAQHATALCLLVLCILLVLAFAQYLDGGHSILMLYR